MQSLATAIVEKLVPVIAAQVMDMSLPVTPLSGDRVPAQRLCSLSNCPDPTSSKALVTCSRCNQAFHAPCLARHNATRHERRKARRQDRPDRDGPTNEPDRQSKPAVPGTLQRSDRPTVRPVHQRLTEQEPIATEVLVTIGFKTRPLRDGGGKISPGRLLPFHRPPNVLSTKGAAIMTYAQSCSAKLVLSLAQKDKCHPF